MRSFQVELCLATLHSALAGAGSHTTRTQAETLQQMKDVKVQGRDDRIFFFDESESEYYSYIRKFSNPNPNIIRDFKKDSNIFEPLKKFEYSKIIRIIQLFLNKIW